MEEIIAIIAREMGIPTRYVTSTVELLEGGATVPFISRYRKEATGSMDEVKVENVLNRLLELKELQKRKAFISSKIEAQDALTPELEAKLTACWDAAEIEDIYLPFKPKRRTRAEVAREKGLEPLAKALLKQGSELPDISKYINDKVPDRKAAIDGAKDIIAEWVNEDARSRSTMRTSFAKTAMITSRVVKGKEGEGAKYRNYFEVSEPLKRCASHRLMAMRRGEREGILRIDISPSAQAVERLERIHVKGAGPVSTLVREAVDDAYARLLKPSIENEFASLSRRDADMEAIEVFAANLRGLLLSAPLGGRQLMAIDPGFRTGCKVVILSKHGSLLHHDTIYPHSKQDQRVYAEMQVLKMVDKYDIHTMAIGSGTAGRETREFIEELYPDGEMEIYMVNEDGASVYSASEVARREFPDQDITVRGAVSIGRRLMDPLSELVKIDPKSIGVGQYQHDVDQTLLKKKLDAVTMSCVNTVGVNLNTASRELLAYVSGLGPALGAGIVAFRDANGDFTDRRELLHVPRLGAKAFEQCAGFLRIPGAKNPLDNSAVHPERYKLVVQMAHDAGLESLPRDLAVLRKALSALSLEHYATGEVGMETLTDIMAELAKPGRDPRGHLEQAKYDTTIQKIEDLHEGMELPGVVSNVTNFGCFVDLGIHHDGLVHVSQLTDKRGADPKKIVHVQQRVNVKVMSVDLERGRISLTMRGVAQPQ